VIKTTKSILTSILIYQLSACGGGGGESDSSAKEAVTQQPSNVAPTVSAGVDQDVKLKHRVTLGGSASDSDGTIQSYKWEHTTTIGGQAAITLLDTDKATAYFDTKFNIPEKQTFTFMLTVTDNDGATSSDEVKVTLLPIEHVDIQLPDKINQARLTRLSDNLILVTGGCSAIYRINGLTKGCPQPSFKSFLLNLEDNSLTQIGDINFAKPYSLFAQSTTLLNDGRVLLHTQDWWDPERKKYFAEIYDPNTQLFQAIDSMSRYRDATMPVHLTDDTVLFFGGVNPVGYNVGEFLTDSIEAFDAETNKWSVLNTKLPESLAYLVTASLPNNRALLFGGFNTSENTNKAYIYDHVNQTIKEIDSINPPDDGNGKEVINIHSNGGGDFTRFDLDDGSFCLIPRGNNDFYRVRFNADSETFIYETEECDTFYQLDGHELIGAAHVVTNEKRSWILQQINDVDMEYNADCDCYEYKEAMTIRVIK